MAMNLTDRTLRAMKPKPDGSQREIFDGDAAACRHAAPPRAVSFQLHLHVADLKEASSENDRDLSGMVAG